jgi:uncharacterized RDD family membrane protein YckC
MEENNKLSCPGFFIRIFAGIADIIIIAAISLFLASAYLNIKDIRFPVQKWNMVDHIVDIIINNPEITNPCIFLTAFILLTYFALFETFFRATPGKFVFSMRIVTVEDHEKTIGIIKALIRTVFMIITNIIGLSGFLFMLINKRKRTLYDIISRTVVVIYRSKKNAV